MRGLVCSEDSSWVDLTKRYMSLGGVDIKKSMWLRDGVVVVRSKIHIV